MNGMATTLVTEACRLIEATDDRVPTAPELARALDVSPDQLRRAFARVLGVSPRQYGDTLRRERLRRHLRRGRDVTGALFQAGYGSTSRLYEGAHDHLGMTPASYRAGGAGATIGYTVADSPLGALLVAATERGLCKVDVGDDAATLEARLAREFHGAARRRDDEALAPLVDAVLSRIDGNRPAGDVPLDVRGTAFQRRVWEELRRIPLGETRTYSEVAAAIGAPGASRAVGSACGANPVPVVVPCHRVVPASGGVGNYGLGPERKRRLLEREGASRAR
jgi:AraC family transcriptional regulator of adaptative response/methylated-DNA-[protein]-cysteine methyltransferase